MIGTTAALILGGSAIAGKIGQAALQSRAAGKAAKSQIASADKAIGVQQDVYRSQMAGMQPYANMGTGPANSLARLMTPGRPYTPAQRSVGSGRTLGASMAAPPPAQPGGGAMVHLRAPDGSMQAVPGHLAEQFIARGAQRV